MKLLLQGHEDRYAVEQLQLSLFPGEPMELADAPFDGDGAVSKLCRGKKWLTAVTTVTRGGQICRGRRRLLAEKETVSLRRRILQQSYYQAALPFLAVPPPWGALAGVRPTKLSTRCLIAGGSIREADMLLRDAYFVTRPRRELALSCSQATVEAVGKLEETDVSVYVGIPFCPTRCSYCSFVSREIGRQTDLLEPYLQALLTEIQVTGGLMASSGCRMRTLYIGGGTPTTLSSGQLCRLLEALHAAFAFDRCLEFTVEAGRPDTLDREKLAVLRSGGVTRLSINPQSMNDRVLAACGRPHTASDVLRAWEQAGAAGFDNVNMDLIAGLPMDTPDSFRRSLDTLIALCPANLTVHTLALKKGADLFDRREDLPSPEAVGQMIGYAHTRLPGAGYRPYYLYRQKYMSGSFENVGWSLPGQECLYNIYMMEELHTIVSLGGGGMSKLNLPGGAIRRFHNPKYPEPYIAGLQEVLEQKRAFFAQRKGSI